MPKVGNKHYPYTAKGKAAAKAAAKKKGMTAKAGRTIGTPVKRSKGGMSEKDNLRLQKALDKYADDKHQMPDWFFQKIKRMLAEQKGPIIKK